MTRARSSAQYQQLNATQFLPRKLFLENLKTIQDESNNASALRKVKNQAIFEKQQKLNAAKHDMQKLKLTVIQVRKKYALTEDCVLDLRAELDWTNK
mgnify:CR=1 FL=1|tara:strand:+ start:591 stop:881 length:291 start_codon:yes stop_codon:yes gene_type:complete